MGNNVKSAQDKTNISKAILSTRYYGARGGRKKKIAIVESDAIK